MKFLDKSYNNTTKEDWTKFINSKCPICKNIPSYPVRFKALKCPCRNREVYCLTCLRDNTGINGFDSNSDSDSNTEKSITTCPTCNRNIASLSQKNKMKANDIYYPLHYVADLYDEKYGQITCPRNCEWKGFRSKLKEHFQECTKSMRKCQFCRKTFPNIAYKSHELSCGMELPLDVDELS